MRRQNTVGQHIKTTREFLGVSQWDLVNTVNTMFNKRSGMTVSRRHLSNVELGSSGISNTKLFAVTAALEKLSTTTD
jgi:hypothetical protein